MTISRLFSTVFDEEMKSRGYKRKTKLYYKLDGEMLKGVVIRCINPYIIDFNVLPYWYEPYLQYIDDQPLTKGYWAEDEAILHISPGMLSYYRKENERLNSDYMTLCLELAKKYILPRFDKVNDIDSYIELITYDWRKNATGDVMPFASEIDTKEFGEQYAYMNDYVQYGWCRYTRVLQYVMLEKALIDKSFEPAYKIFKEILTEYRQKEYYSKVFFDAMNSGDLEWIERYKQQRKAIIAPRLRDELGLDTFHL